MVEWSCFLAAATLLAGSVVRIVFYATVHFDMHGTFSWEKYKDLDPTYLRTHWIERDERHSLYMASGFLNCIGWLLFAYPVIQMAWILSKQGSRAITLNTMIGVLALFGSLTELMSNFFYLGMVTMSRHVVSIYEMNEENGGNWIRPDAGKERDGMGWRVLEMNHIVGTGFITFTDSFEWLALSGIFICTFASVRGWLLEDQTSFGTRWNTMGLFISFVCILEFAAEILRFQEGRHSFSRIFAVVTIIYALLNRVILIPTWIIALGFMLPRATMKATFENPPPAPVESELQLSEIRPEQSASDKFTIGEDDDLDDATPADGDDPDHSATSDDSPPRYGRG